MFLLNFGAFCITDCPKINAEVSLKHSEYRIAPENQL